MGKSDGVDKAIVNDGTIAKEVQEQLPGGVDKVLELVGTTSPDDCIRRQKIGGTICRTEMLGNIWSLPDFGPIGPIQTAVNLTTCEGRNEDVVATSLTDLRQHVEAGKLRVQFGKVFKTDDIGDAHKTMDAITAGSKIVVLT